MGVSGAVRGTAGFEGYYRSAIGSNRRFCYYTDWKHPNFRLLVLSQCTVRMLAGRVVEPSMSSITKSCACATLAFLADIAWSVDSTLLDTGVRVTNIMLRYIKNFHVFFL